MKNIKLFIILLSLGVTLNSCTKTPDTPGVNPYGLGNGQYSFVTETPGIGTIYVVTDNYSGSITHVSKKSEDCEDADVVFIKTAGNYSYTASGGGHNWSGTFTVVEGECNKTILTTSSGGGGTDLDGKWLSSSGTGLNISGSSGTFYAFSSTWTNYYVANGFVGVGDAGLKSISKTSSTTWDCLALTGFAEGGVGKYVFWSDDGTITMSSDGKSFNLTGNATATNGTKSIINSTWTRQ